MRQAAIWIIVLVLLVSGCSDTSSSTEKPLVISTDVWIGASPLYYAHEMGWLREANIEMLQARSINENIQFFESGASDLFTGTQHEYNRIRKSRPDLIPIIMYDRSYGGDVVMANRSLDEICRSTDTISVYLEANSVSEELLQYLIQFEGISKDRLAIRNRTQDEMARMRTSADANPVIVITYNPHDLMLKKGGFQQIASSKDDNYLVVDAVYIPDKLNEKHAEQLRMFHAAMQRSLKAFEANPKAFYEKVKPYLGNPSYEEFMQMRQNIVWLNNKPTPEMVQRLREIEFPTQDLIR